jgi:hypothetical protein
MGDWDKLVGENTDQRDIPGRLKINRPVIAPTGGITLRYFTIIKLISAQNQRGESIVTIAYLVDNLCVQRDK